MKKLVAALLIFLLAQTAHGTISAPRAEAERYGTITLSVPPQGWPPYVIQNESDEKPEGILADVLREIALAEGYELRLVFYPEKRGHMLLQEGRVDVIPKAMEWVEDPSTFLWTDPVIDSADVVVSSPDQPHTVHLAEGPRGVERGPDLQL